MAFPSTDLHTGGWASTGASVITALSTVSSALSGGVHLTASTGNLIGIWVSASTAMTLTTTDAGSGYLLSPGASVDVPIQDATKLYCASTAAGASLTWIGG